VRRALDESHRFVRRSAESTSTRPSSSVPKSGGDPPNQRSMSTQAAILAAAVAYAPKIPARPRRRARRRRVGASSPLGAVRHDGAHGQLGPAAPPLDVRAGHGPAARRRGTPAAGGGGRARAAQVPRGARGGAGRAGARAAQESDMPNVKGSFLGRVPLVLADFWTSDRLSERSRSVDAFSGTRARGTPASKRRCISLVLPRRGPGAAAASLAAISLYGVFFGLSLGPIPNIYTAESFPTRAPAPDAAAGSGGPDRTSSLSSSVASKSIRPDGGRIDGPRRPLDGR